MVTARSSKRFEQIINAAGHAFACFGWKRTQMADIATEANVALGTLYSYSASKEELFELALLRAVGVTGEDLWNRSNKCGMFEQNVLDWVRELLIERSHCPRLEAAIEMAPPDDIESELCSIIGETYDAIDRLHVAIRMLDRSTREWPHLEQLFVDYFRAPSVEKLAHYLKLRISSGHLPLQKNIGVTTRIVLETCAWMAMHRRFTSGGPVTSDEIARQEAVRFVFGGLMHPMRQSTTEGRQ